MAETKKTDFNIEELKAQLRAEIKAELKAESTLEQKPKEKPAPDLWLEEYVPVELFKDGKDYKDDVFVCVNGENCRIKRGVPVKIKRKFALVLENSRAQDIAAAEYAQARQEEYREEAKRYDV